MSLLLLFKPVKGLGLELLISYIKSMNCIIQRNRVLSYGTPGGRNVNKYVVRRSLLNEVLPFCDSSAPLHLCEFSA